MFRELLLEAHRHRDFDKMERIVADMQRSGLPLPLETHMLLMKTAHSFLYSDKAAPRSAKHDTTPFASASTHQGHAQMQRIWRAYVQSGQKMNAVVFAMYMGQFRNPFFMRELQTAQISVLSSDKFAHQERPAGPAMASSHTDIISGAASPYTHLDGLLLAEASSALSVFLRAGGQLDATVAAEVLQMFVRSGHVRGLAGTLDLCLHWQVPIPIELLKTLVFDMLVDNGALQAACQVCSSSMLLAFCCCVARAA